MSELKVYRKERINDFNTAIMKDQQGKAFKIISGSPFLEVDYNKLSSKPN